MQESVQNHMVSKDIVSQPVALPADPPLPFARLYPRQFLNLVPAAAIVRIFNENADKFVQCVDQCQILLG